MKTLIASAFGGLILLVAAAVSAEPVASVVALRGKATVERGVKKLDAQPRLGIELQDTVATGEGGRVKLLFIDDSVLTLAEKSRMSVDTFIHSRSDRGKSLFNLLDGKMRAVVGKTRFEVKTPTVVAAARGTVILFETGMLNGQPYTRVTCLEGIVDVRSVTAASGTPGVQLTPGHSMLVLAGQPLPMPTPLTPAEIEKLKRDTAASGEEIRLPDVATGGAIIGNVEIKPIQPPVINQQQPIKQPSRVDIGVKF